MKKILFVFLLVVPTFLFSQIKLPKGYVYTANYIDTKFKKHFLEDEYYTNGIYHVKFDMPFGSHWEGVAIDAYLQSIKEQGYNVLLTTDNFRFVLFTLHNP